MNNNVNKVSKMNSGVKSSCEGGVVYQAPFKDVLSELFSLGMLNGNFYQSQEEVLKEAKNVFDRALSECPEFATKCAIYGHEFNSMRLVPTVWLVYLSTLENKTLFKKAFPRIITTVDMLYNFMEICRKAEIRNGLGRSVKRAINNCLIFMLNDYQACRYKNKISEIAKTTRPASNNEKFQNVMKYIAKDELSFERIVALKHVLKSMELGEIDNEILLLIKSNRLQLEELKHSTKNLTSKDKQKVYSCLYEGLNYAALIRNLVALERVFATKTEDITKFSVARGMIRQKIVVETDIPSQIVENICKRVDDEKAYRKTNMLPFALITAEKMTSVPEFKSSLSTMLRNTAENTFDINKDISLMVGIDTSYSMRNAVNDSLSCMDIATLFGALIKKSHTNSDIFAVADIIENVPLNKQEDVFDMAHQIGKTDVGCGTYFEQIMCMYRGQKYIILITDDMPADNLESAWLNAKNKPEGAKLIIWKLVENQNHTSRHPSVVHLYGFSDRILGLVKNIIEDKSSQVDEIEKIVI